MLRTLLLVWDDDTRVSLSECIKSMTSQLNVVGQTSTVSEGVVLYRDLNPDLVVIAEKMEDGSGMSFLQQIHHDPCERIFLCNNEDSQLEALVYGAVSGRDDRSDILRVLKHMMSRRNYTLDDLCKLYFDSLHVIHLDHIALPAVDGLFWVHPQQIVRVVKAGGRNCMVLLQDKVLQVHWSFRKLASILHPLGFQLNNVGDLVKP